MSDNPIKNGLFESSVFGPQANAWQLAPDEQTDISVSPFASEAQSGEATAFEDISGDGLQGAVFNLPSIFNPQKNDELVCIEGEDESVCLQDIEISEKLQDHYADYALLDLVDKEEVLLSADEESYLRMHAAKILIDFKKTLESGVPPATTALGVMGIVLPAYGKPSIDVGENNLSIIPKDCVFDLLGLNHGDDFATGFLNPYGLSVPNNTNKAATRQLDNLIASILIGDADLSAVLKIEKGCAKSKIRAELHRKAENSYYDHSSEIEALSLISDPDQLAKSVEGIGKRIIRGHKLRVLGDAASGVGGGAMLGGKYVNLAGEVKALSKVDIDDEKSFYEGVKKFTEESLKIVVMANMLDFIIETCDEGKKASKEIVFGHKRGTPTFTDHMSCSMGTPMQKQICMSSRAAFENKQTYQIYFDQLKYKAIAARALLGSGNLEASQAKLKEIYDDDEFTEMIQSLEGDVELTEGYKYSIKIGIIVTSAMIANVAGGWVAAALEGTGAPAWVVSLGAITAESGAFLTGEKVLSFPLLGELPFDPNVGAGQNAALFTEQWVLTGFMFKFLHKGMAMYEKFSQRLINRAKLGFIGKVLNTGGKFSAEYVSFTAWDYLAGSYEASKAEGALALPKDFLTGGKMFERFKFLLCLKIGGALASPITSSIKSKVASRLLKKHGKLEKTMDGKGNATPSNLEKTANGKGNATPSNLKKTSNGKGKATPSNLKKTSNGKGKATPSNLEKTSNGKGKATPSNLKKTSNGKGKATPSNLEKTPNGKKTNGGPDVDKLTWEDLRFLDHDVNGFIFDYLSTSTECGKTLNKLRNVDGKIGREAEEFYQEVKDLESLAPKFEKFYFKYLETGKIAEKDKEFVETLLYKVLFLERSPYYRKIEIEYNNMVKEAAKELEPLMISLQNLSMPHQNGLKGDAPIEFVIDYKPPEALFEHIPRGLTSASLDKIADISVDVASPDIMTWVKKQLFESKSEVQGGELKDFNLKHNYDFIDATTGIITGKELVVVFPSAREVSVKIEVVGKDTKNMEGYFPEPVTDIFVTKEGKTVEQFTVDVQTEGKMKVLRYIDSLGRAVAEVKMNGNDVIESLVDPQFKGMSLISRLKSLAVNGYSKIDFIIDIMKEREIEYELYGVKEDASALVETFRKTPLGKNMMKRGFSKFDVKYKKGLFHVSAW